MIEHHAAWSPKGELGRWIIAKPAVVRLGTSLFVHGGLSPAYAAMPIDEINRRVAASLAARETAPNAIINDPLGPLWYRGLAGMAAPETSRHRRSNSTRSLPRPAPGGSSSAIRR